MNKIQVLDQLISIAAGDDSYRISDYDVCITVFKNH